MRLRSYLLLLVPLSLVSGEIVARFYLGLGTPPLFITHPKIEYLYRPNQDVLRFGTRQIYNEYSMRNYSITTFRGRKVVMVFGDSVLNGGALTDHSDLATTLLTDDRHIFVNISAGSWGPQNIGAYWAEFRDRLPYKNAILVLNSHDYSDLPTFAPLNPETHPTKNPTSAFVEGISIYLPRYLPWKSGKGGEYTEPTAPSNRERIKGEEALKNMLAGFRGDGVSLCVVRHYTQQEMKSGPEFGDAPIKAILEHEKIKFVDMRAIYPQGQDKAFFFRDNIHLNQEGQKILARAMAQCTYPPV